MTRKIYLAGQSEIPSEIIIGTGESLEMTVIVLPGTDCTIPLRVILAGRDASLDLCGLSLCNATQNVELSIEVRHEADGCRSRQQFRCIAGGESRYSFFGKITVLRDAQGTKAYQESRNILLSDTASAEAKPQLEIYADDVECSHGATVGSLDEAQNFYMRSRGIPEEEARVLQMISFISPIAETVQDPVVKKRIYDSLSEC
ncbi:MAG: SufD family Fe-S cluster assembly protein [Bacteroidales bacterium]|nr:SufD family Fe-S cluster assembly protein [Bacteroidales bacterium]